MEKLHEWFQQNRREFPWREAPTPYKVWVSEVMLQQTRAAVVIPYFERWLGLFPDVAALAAAPLDRVIKAWEGLGYYSRARNLWKGAAEIVERFGGAIPSTREELESIRGIGTYTAGAILSFGFKKRAAAVDGNVIRVIARLDSIEESVDKQRVKRRIQERAEELLDRQEPWVTAEALIELGAMVCAPRPRCSACPLQTQCLGKEKAESLPIKKGEREVTHLRRAVVWLEAEGNVLVKRGEPGQVMADLYEFPYFEMGGERWSARRVIQSVRKTFGIKAEWIGKLGEVTHTFTRYKARLYPFHLKVAAPQPIEGYEWIPHERLRGLPFSSGHRRILER